MIPDSRRVVEMFSTPDSSRSLTYYDNSFSLAEPLSQFYSVSPVLRMALLQSTLGVPSGLASLTRTGSRAGIEPGSCMS